METWGVEHTLVIAVVIGTEASDDGPVMVVAEDIFRKCAADALHTVYGAVDELLVEFVVGEARSYREFMVGVDDIGVEQQVGIVRELIGVVVLQSKIGIQLVVGQLLLDAEAGLGTVEDEARFGEGLITLRVDADAIQSITFFKPALGVEVHLAAEAFLFQRLHAELAAEMTGIGMVITQESAVLLGDRIVEEAVAVAIHLHGIEAYMTQ